MLWAYLPRYTITNNDLACTVDGGATTPAECCAACHSSSTCALYYVVSDPTTLVTSCNLCGTNATVAPDESSVDTYLGVAVAHLTYRVGPTSACHSSCVDNHDISATTLLPRPYRQVPCTCAVSTSTYCEYHFGPVIYNGTVAGASTQTARRTVYSKSAVYDVA